MKQLLKCSTAYAAAPSLAPSAAKYCCLPSHKYQQKVKTYLFHLRQPAWVSPHVNITLFFFGVSCSQSHQGTRGGQFKCHTFIIRSAVKLCCLRNWSLSLALSRAKPTGNAQKTMVSWLDPHLCVKVSAVPERSGGSSWLLCLHLWELLQQALEPAPKCPRAGNNGLMKVLSHMKVSISS